MRAVFVVMAAWVALALSGCAVADFLFGVSPDGTQRPDGGFLGVAAPVLNVLLPGLGSVAGLAGGLYAGLRRAKGWKDAFRATAEVVEGWKDGEAKKDLAAAHSAAGVTALIQPVLRQVEENAQ